MVGVNKYTNDEPEQFAVFQPDPEAARLAIATIAPALRDAAMELVLIDCEPPEDVVSVAIQ